MPGSGQTFEQFQSDDAACRQWAQQQSGDAATSANQSTAAGAVIRTVIGGGAGRGHRRRRGQSGRGRGHRGGQRALRRHRGGRQCRHVLGRRRAATLRRRVPAMHVRERPPDPRPASHRLDESGPARPATATAASTAATAASTTTGSLAVPRRAARRGHAPPRAFPSVRELQGEDKPAMTIALARSPGVPHFIRALGLALGLTALGPAGRRRDTGR